MMMFPGNDHTRRPLLQMLHQQLQQQAVQAAQQQHVVQQVAQTAVQLQQQAVAHQHQQQQAVQQLLPDGTPILPLYPQHMTPQQQQMYQQQMQQQHQAQHLKKTRRSLPHQQDMSIRQHQTVRILKNVVKIK